MSMRALTRSAISAISAKTVRITIFAKNWKNRRGDENMSTRALTKSAISEKTAKLTIFGSNWKNRRVDGNLSKLALIRSAISAISAKTARITIIVAKKWKNC